jgi:hypothetical protein
MDCLHAAAKTEAAAPKTTKAATAAPGRIATAQSGNDRASNPTIRTLALQY